MWNPPTVEQDNSEDAVPINSDALASSISGLAQLRAGEGGGLERALEHVVDETNRIFAVDGAGLLLLAEGDVLRYVAASSERARILETLQEQVDDGPCVDAFERIRRQARASRERVIDVARRLVEGEPLDPQAS